MTEMFQDGRFWVLFLGVAATMPVFYFAWAVVAAPVNEWVGRRADEWVKRHAGSVDGVDRALARLGEEVGDLKGKTKLNLDLIGTNGAFAQTELVRIEDRLEKVSAQVGENFDLVDGIRRALYDETPGGFLIRRVGTIEARIERLQERIDKLSIDLARATKSGLLVKPEV